jgi:hypothetical protein
LKKGVALTADVDYDSVIATRNTKDTDMNAATTPKKTLMDYAVDEWYRVASAILDPKHRAYYVAEQYELDPEEVHAACQADVRQYID